MSDPSLNAPMLRVRPRVWIGLAIWFGYIVVVFVVQLLSRVPYPALGDNGSNLFWGAGLSLIVGTILLAITTSVLGWWRPALYERRHSARWPIIVPALMALAAIGNLLATDWSSFDPPFFGASIVLLLVGFTEELTTRGLLLVGLRSRLGEGWVWFVSTALFALMHAVNVLSGQPVGSVIPQIGNAFLAGTIFYILRRTSGTLLWAMVLHGLWDFSVFAVGHGRSTSALLVAGPALELAAGILGLIVVAFVIRGAQEKTGARFVDEVAPRNRLERGA